MKKHIAIVGFGLTGRLAALGLADEFTLSIFEASDIQAASSAGAVAAAMLAPQAESVLCEPDLAELGLRAIARWPEIIGHLNGDVFFQQQGALIVAHPQDFADLQLFANRLKPLEQQQAQWLNREQINQLEPALGTRFQKGIFLPCEGQLDNAAFYQASCETLLQKDITWHFGSRVSINGNEIAGQAFDLVIDCRGLGAKPDLTKLRGVRGEVARVYAPEVALSRPVRLMHPRYPIYIVPKPNHEFVIGATEIESQDEGAVTVRSTLELLSAAYTIDSGFAEAKIISLKSGLRPSFVDNRPQITLNKQLISINGLYRHGYLLAPVLVDEVVRQAQHLLLEFDFMPASAHLAGLVQRVD
ncbi:FAD-dependent oxidoreductase [Pseudoalteromonas tunicata]|jgi:glycine oxidase|uniref:D-amino-acid oxidase n=1 Tax=Pseudoalteromonas tunicata D2 TaxID=87626 RepID=A4C8K8_9GAMM|nr:FAD-dependent oxidoreductase [Pseudoalteromonas tunicata]ATC93427.1 glycine oxidase [Pseudoalteromonas tunicata]AXT32469.1 FAD-dependent oxidoreductase [Pseudoalteromonas tunicata]EAR28923.1 putative thiamine biosynthesis oxidoreductase [Pseudoalteromonas tunicata D2]